MLAHRARRGRAVVVPAPNWPALVPALTALHTSPPAPSEPAAAGAGAGAAASERASDTTGTARGSGVVAKGDSKAVGGAYDDDSAVSRLVVSGARARRPLRIRLQPATVRTRHACALPPVRLARLDLTESEHAQLQHWSLRQERHVRHAPRDALRDSVCALRETLRKLDVQQQQQQQAGSADALPLPLPLPSLTVASVPRHAADCEGPWRSVVLSLALRDVAAAQRDVRRLHARWDVRDAAAAHLIACVQRASACAQHLHDWHTRQWGWQHDVARRAESVPLLRRLRDAAVEELWAVAPQIAKAFAAPDPASEAAAWAVVNALPSKGAVVRYAAWLGFEIAEQKYADAAYGYPRTTGFIGAPDDDDDDDDGDDADDGDSSHRRRRRLLLLRDVLPSRSERCALRVECW